VGVLISAGYFRKLVLLWQNLFCFPNYS
jgi:hypothetical protein